MKPCLVSVVIPCKNEEKYIENCINSVMKFELPEKVSLEVFVVDGLSTDKTLSLLSNLQIKYSNLKVIHNQLVFQSYAINLSLKETKGDYIMRLDAHSIYPINYLKTCLETAIRTNADNVGGLVITLPGGVSFEANLVQALTTHKFGVGNSGFRTGIKEEGPVDTVPFGFFKRSLFDRIGLFDERLVRAQDYEFNKRITASGGVVWSNSDICSEYYNQPTLTAFYKKQLFKEAPYNAYLWYLAPYAFAYRHAISGVFASGILGGAILSFLSVWVMWPYFFVLFLYFTLAILSSIHQAIRFKDIRHAFLLPFCFFLFHFIHGLGVIGGLFNLLIRKAPVQKQKEPWPNAGKFRAFPL